MFRTLVLSLSFVLTTTTPALAESDNKKFHDRFTDQYATSMVKIDCDDSAQNIRVKSIAGVTAVGDCYTLETDPFTDDVGNVNYTIQARAITDVADNIIILYYMRLNSGARVYLQDVPAEQMLGWVNRREAAMMSQWNKPEKLKLGLLKSAFMQLAQRHDGGECLAAVKRHSPSAKVLALTCSSANTTSKTNFASAMKAVK